MKTKKMISKKLIVSALSTTMGVSLVGAISGTVAWYQYSTRSTVSFVGTSVATSENLLVSLNENSGYHNDIGHGEVASALQSNTSLAPVTTGAIEKNGALPEKFKAQPIYQHFDYDEWISASESAYVQFTVYVRLNQLDNTGAEVAVTEQRKVYLSDLLIQNDTSNGKSDISDAIRVHLSSKHENMLLSKTGEDTEVNGKLDLNGDGDLDTNKPAYDFITHNASDEVAYGEGVQKAYKLADVKDMTGGHYLGKLNSGKAVKPAASTDALGAGYFMDEDLTTTAAAEVPDGNTTYYVLQEALPVTITIWLEGWQKLTASSTAVQVEAGGSLAGLFEDAQCTKPASGNAAQAGTYYKDPVKEAMWDPAKYIGAIFDVGLMFEVETNNN